MLLRTGQSQRFHGRAQEIKIENDYRRRGKGIYPMKTVPIPKFLLIILNVIVIISHAAMFLAGQSLGWDRGRADQYKQQEKAYDFLMLLPRQPKRKEVQPAKYLDI
jgi:hypothetical protein